jgi:heat shock protein HslJ
MGDLSRSLVDGTVITAGFQQGLIQGHSGCNAYGSHYSTEGSTISFDEVEQTAMGCPGEGIMTQESDFVNGLIGAKTFVLDGDRLTISSDDGSLLFRQMPSLQGPPFRDTTWHLVAEVFQGVVRSIEKGIEITAEFADRQMTGSAGCNSYFAGYSVDNNVLTLSGIGNTERACEDAIMEQERSFLSALQFSSRLLVALDESRLVLVHDDGSLIFTTPGAEEAEGPDTDSSPVGQTAIDNSLPSFEGRVMRAIEALNFELFPDLIGDSFSIALWRSEGWTGSAEEALVQLRTNYLTGDNFIQFPEPPDLSGQLEGKDILSVWNPETNPVSALFSVGWGPAKGDEAFLIITQDPNGLYTWAGHHRRLPGRHPLG